MKNKHSAVITEKGFKHIALTVGLLLLIPVYGNFFINGWNWGIEDFIFAVILWFITGLAIDFAIRKLVNPVLRVVAVLTILLILALIWIEVATDAISTAIVAFL